MEAQKKTALNRINYHFELTRQERAPSGSTYVLRVSPKRKDRFLYRGRIWVDAKDFAVIRLEAEPAKNPSFWAKSSEIERIYKKVGVFWLPSSDLQYHDSPVWGARPHGDSVQQLPDHQPIPVGAARGL